MKAGLTSKVKKRIFQILEQVARERGIDRHMMAEILRMALLSAAKKHYGRDENIKIVLDEEAEDIGFCFIKKVVKRVKDDISEIALGEAAELDPEAKVGDMLECPIDTEELGRISAQAARQIMLKRLSELEKEVIYNEFKVLEGTVLTGVFKREEPHFIVVGLGRADGIIPRREAIPGEAFRRGELVKVYLLEVRDTPKGPQIILSRAHPDLVIRLIENEIPEIADGIIEIKSVVREPGGRTKIALLSTNPNVDPVGACVGMKGTRIQPIIRALKGEKIDIVRYSDDPVDYVKSALNPAEILQVHVDASDNRMCVVVADDQLSIAIGRKGQNARLAVRLTGWKIDIKSVSEARTGKELADEEKKQAVKNLLLIPGLGLMCCERLFDLGIQSLEILANTDVETLKEVPGIGGKKAKEFIGMARQLVAEHATAEKESDIET